MSTLQVDNLSKRDGTDTIPMNTVSQGTAKVWFNLNGTSTISARDTFNISSFTDHGVGEFTGTFTIALPNANYSFNATLFSPAAIGCICYTGSTPNTTTSIRLGAVTPSPQNFYDNTYNEVVVHGDLS